MSIDHELLMKKREAVQRTLVDLAKDDRAKITTGEAMANMQNLDAWKFIAKVWEKQLADLRNLAEGSPMDGEDGIKYALRMERIKGTIVGIRLALEQPGIMIAIGTETRKRLLGDKDET